MSGGFDRRAVIAGSLGLLAAGCGPSIARMPPESRAFAELEARSGGRLGIHAIDTATGARFGWRDGERFAHCSSFKLSLAASVLDGARKGRWRLDERLTWSAAQVLPVSPVSGPATASGLTMRDLARAALVESDNTAANVLLARTGGPPALTAWWRGIGDRVSRLDHNEPALNRVPPGTVSDTTTPSAMARTVARLVVGPALAEAEREVLKGWMRASATGLRRLRAGFPAGWDAGDKTGTNPSPPWPCYVDIGFGGPPGRAPLVVAAYFVPGIATGTIDPAAEAVIADAARLCAGLSGIG